MDLNIIEVVLLLIAFYILLSVWKLESRIKGIKYTVDQIAQQVELPENPVNNELRVLIQEGKDTRAIKVARETLGLSLLEGKQYVEALKIDEK